MHFYEMDTDDPERSYQAMTPLVEQRIGAAGHRRVEALGVPPELRIMYVNTFRRVGERASDATRPTTSSPSSHASVRAATFSDAPVDRRRRSRACSTPRRTRRARRTSNRGSSSSSATPSARAAIGDLTRRAWETPAARSPRRDSHPKLLADVERGATGGIAARRCTSSSCADTERGLEHDRAVVDLPRGAEPAARRDRARPRQRAHDDRGRLPRRAPRVCSACPTTWSPSPSSRSVTRRARSAHPDGNPFARAHAP